MIPQQQPYSAAVIAIRAALRGRGIESIQAKMHQFSKVISIVNCKKAADRENQRSDVFDSGSS